MLTTTSVLALNYVGMAMGIVPYRSCPVGIVFYAAVAYALAFTVMMWLAAGALRKCQVGAEAASAKANALQDQYQTHSARLSV